MLDDKLYTTSSQSPNYIVFLFVAEVKHTIRRWGEEGGGGVESSVLVGDSNLEMKHKINFGVSIEIMSI